MLKQARDSLELADSSLVAILSGIGVLLSYNILITMMQSILGLCFKGDPSVNDSGLLAFQVALVAAAIALLPVQCLDTFFGAVMVSGFLNLAGTVLCVVCLLSEEANVRLFVLSLAIIGLATGVNQVGQFAIAANEALTDHKLTERISMGLGFAGVLTWAASLIAQMLFMDPVTKLLNRHAILSLLAASAVFTLVVNCAFCVVLWPRARPAEIREVTGAERTVPGSLEPLCSETVLQQRSAASGQADDIGDHGGIFSDDTGDEDKGGWGRASVYIALMFVTFATTLMCFPSLAPLRWNVGEAAIWYIGIYQCADIAGRFLATALPNVPLPGLTALVIARVGLVGWCALEAVSGAGIMSRAACVIILSLTSSCLFTVIMQQGPVSLKSDIAVTASTLLLFALMFGVVVGVWLCGKIVPYLLPEPMPELMLVR